MIFGEIQTQAGSLQRELRGARSILFEQLAQAPLASSLRVFGQSNSRGGINQGGRLLLTHGRCVVCRCGPALCQAAVFLLTPMITASFTDVAMQAVWDGAGLDESIAEQKLNR